MWGPLIVTILQDAIARYFQLRVEPLRQLRVGEDALVNDCRLRTLFVRHRVVVDQLHPYVLSVLLALLLVDEA